MGNFPQSYICWQLISSQSFFRSDLCDYRCSPLQASSVPNTSATLCCLPALLLLCALLMGCLSLVVRTDVHFSASPHSRAEPAVTRVLSPHGDWLCTGSSCLSAEGLAFVPTRGRGHNLSGESARYHWLSWCALESGHLGELV